jgi:uncharacterized protein (TIGR01244 family)
MNTNLVFCLLATCVIVLSSCARPASKAAEEPQIERPPITRAEKTDIENYSRIDGSSGFAGSTVGFGGSTPASAMSWLRGEGFATVINLRLATEEGVDLAGCRAAAKAVGLNYVHLPFEPEDPASRDTQVINNVLAALGDKANHPVYIHCHSATRVAAIWMIGRVLRDGWKFDAAREEADEIAEKPEAANAFVTQYLASLRE